jgi:hypothetical protein
MMARRTIIVFVLAVALIAGALFRGNRAPSRPQPPVPAHGPVSSPAMSEPHATAPAPAKTRKLSPDERKHLGEQIAAAIHKAREARAAQARAAGSAVADEDPVIPLEAIGPELKDAMTAAIPILAECFEHAGITDPRTAVAQMTMASDPDLGTVVDTAEILGPDNQKLPPALDTCLRDTIDSLALPPLGQPGKLQVQYSFKFDRD